MHQSLIASVKIYQKHSQVSFNTIFEDSRFTNVSKIFYLLETNHLTRYNNNNTLTSGLNLNSKHTIGITKMSGNLL